MVPLRLAWALPADVARGSWATAGVHLVLAVVLVAGLWWVWGHFLAARLVEPSEAGGAAHRVHSSTVVDRLYPVSPAGGVAVRTLRYWRRDPRYLAGVAGIAIAPVVVMVTQLSNDGGSAVVMFAPSLLGLLVGLSLAQDLSYDGTALWLHISAGVRGADDRAGRVLSTLTVYVPLTVLLLVVAVLVTGEWRLLVPVVALTVGLLLTGLGVGCWVGAWWQWPAPPPGANPFQKSNGGLPSVLSMSITLLLTLALAAPTMALVIWSFFTGWVGYLALVVGVAGGLVVLRLGIDMGGQLLDRRWPEAMLAVSERSG